MADPNPHHCLRLKVAIEDQRIGVAYDLDGTSLANLRLNLPSDGLEIADDYVAFLSEEARHFHFVQRAEEIYVEPGVYPLADAWRTLLKRDVIRAHFVTDPVPLEHSLNLRLPNINCHTIALQGVHPQFTLVHFTILRSSTAML
jgi:hypothetical protein